MFHVSINYCFYQTLYDNIIEKQALGLPLPLYYPKEDFFQPQLWHKKLLGRLMLVDIAKKLSPQISPEDVEISIFGKPVFPNVFVSISYTDDIVMVAGCIDEELGIDIEKIRPVDLSLFQGHFTKSEVNYINDSTNFIDAFYEIWTKKESALKADGRGFTIDPLLADVTGESTKLPDRDEKWRFLTIKLIDEYIVTLSANKVPTKIVIREIFPDFLERH